MVHIGTYVHNRDILTNSPVHMHRHTQCFCPLYRELFWENCCWVSGLGEQWIINLSRWLGYACCRDVTDLTLPEYIQGCLPTWKLKTISATLPLTSHGPWCLLGWWQNSCTAKTCGFTGIPAPSFLLFLLKLSITLLFLKIYDSTL